VQQQNEWYSWQGDSPWEESKWGFEHWYPGAFAYHWHNRWQKPWHANSWVAHLIKKFERCDPPKPPVLYKVTKVLNAIGGPPSSPAVTSSLPLSPSLSASSSSPRKIFIDLGAYTGDTLLLYRDHFFVTDTFERVPPGTSWVWQAEAFEVDPTNLQIMTERFKKELADIYNVTTLYPVAAWNQDTMMPFQLSPKAANKNDGALGGSGATKVLCYDIGAWFMNHLKPRAQDSIVLKMDIEGAEVEALDTLEKHGALDFIDHLVLEWHDYIDAKVSSHRARLDGLLNSHGLHYAYATLDDNFVKRYVARASWPVNHCDSHYFRKK